MIKKIITSLSLLFLLFTLLSCGDDEVYKQLMLDRFQSCSCKFYFTKIEENDNVSIYQYRDGKNNISSYKIIYDKTTNEIMID